MAEKPRFYVYKFSDAVGVVYVGKGSGRRFAVQQRRFDCDGEIVDWFLTEAAAYAAERRYIASLQPRVNVHPGGNGSRVKVANRIRRKAFWERNFEKIGSRRYAAMLLLACERSQPGVVDSSKIEQIRQVADGCWA